MRQIPPAHADPRPGETVDQIIDDWWLYQLKAGHRFSTDDLLTAWRAAVWRPKATRLLDLGCGIGSVGTYAMGILAQWGNQDTRLLGVEAQDLSVDLARRSVALNGLQDRVSVVHSDLRAPDLADKMAPHLDHDPRGGFELVTGSPPYIPLGKGVVSKHPQRAACRFELRGSVFDYCEAAARFLAPNGVFSYVMSARDPRTDEAPAAAGLQIVERFDVVFRHGETPMVRVVTAMHPGPEVPSEPITRSLQIRDASGSMTEEYASLRRSFGWSVQ